MKLLKSYKQKHDTEVLKSDKIAGVDKAQRQALQLNYTTFNGIDLSCVFKFCLSYFSIMLSANLSLKSVFALSSILTSLNLNSHKGSPVWSRCPNSALFLELGCRCPDEL